MKCFLQLIVSCEILAFVVLHIIFHLRSTATTRLDQACYLVLDTESTVVFGQG